ncbi:MAG TPA: HD domain-containing phosphohydrolase [Candidatus Baltobacteraceae bacterium]|jgi:response regulator RpfG family c-di-GMP phosphodiesterase
MSLLSAQGANSSPDRGALAELLALFGTVADVVAGDAPDDGIAIASLAVAIASIAGLPEKDRDALFWAALLRNAGAFGNPGLRKGDPLSERSATMLRWDVPADGARTCAAIAALPEGTADLVRWQAEAWDGTGFPDQLRWNGIPKAAQTLHIASAYVGLRAEPEEGLACLAADGGQRFAPEQTRTFIMWFHTFGGEITPLEAPADSLSAGTAPHDIVELLADRVDDHNGTARRWRRIGRRADALATALGLQAQQIRRVTLASALFGLGELSAAAPEAQRFDPLSRLGIEGRAANAIAAAELIAAFPVVADLASVVRARAEWYDGTGLPDRMRHDEIPIESQVLAACVAYDGLDDRFGSGAASPSLSPLEQLESVAGTQFDPRVVRALADVAKVRP